MDKVTVGTPVTVKAVNDNNNKDQGSNESITYTRLNTDHSTTGISYYEFNTSLQSQLRIGQHVIVSIPSKYVKIPRDAIKHHQVTLSNGSKKAITPKNKAKLND